MLHIQLRFSQKDIRDVEKVADESVGRENYLAGNKSYQHSGSNTLTAEHCNVTPSCDVFTATCYLELTAEVL